jgi:hypothetical protein
LFIHSITQVVAEAEVEQAAAMPEKPSRGRAPRTTASTKNTPSFYMTAGDLQHACDMWLTARDLQVITGQQPVKPISMVPHAHVPGDSLCCAPREKRHGGSESSRANMYAA